MKIKGKVEIKFIHTYTGEETRPPLKLENFVHENFYRSSFSNSISVSDFKLFIAYLDNYEYPRLSYDYRLNTNNIAQGEVRAGDVAYKIFTTKEEEVPHFIITRRFRAIGSLRIFNIVGLSSSVYVNYYTHPFTSLIISPYCSQSEFEDLDIYYNIEIPYTGNYFKSRINNLNIIPSIISNKNIRGHHIMKASYHESPLSPRIYGNLGYHFLQIGEGVDHLGTSDIEGENYCQISRVWQTDPSETNHEYTRYGTVLNTVITGCFGTNTQVSIYNPSPIIARSAGTDIGFIEGYNSGLDWFKYEYDPLIVPNAPLQTKYMKIQEAISPYYNPDEEPKNNGNINISGEWTPITSFPEIYRVEILNGGSIGTATYQIWIKKFAQLSKNNNSGILYYNFSDCNIEDNNSNYWENQRPSCISFLHSYLKHKRHHGSFQFYPKLPSPWNKEEIFMYDRKGITRINLFTSEFITWDAFSINTLTATKIKQISFDIPNRYIYIACKATGLYRINNINNSVEHLVIEPCHAVDVGYNSKVFAIFDGRLSNSDNWYTPLPLLTKGINGSDIGTNSFTKDWDYVHFIKINKESTTYDIAIVTTSGNTPAQFNEYYISSNSAIINWWNINNTSSTECTNIYISNFGLCYDPLSLEYWKKGNRWVTHNKLIEFNSTTSVNYSGYTSNTSFTLEDSYQESTNFTIFNKQIDNWEWFGENSFNTNYYYFNSGNPVLWNDNLMADRIYEGYELEVLIKWDGLNLSNRKYHTIYKCFVLDGDLCFYLSSKNYFSLFNLISNQSNTNNYSIKDHAWDKYGWNGSNWILGDPNGKITHNTNEQGIHGLILSFSGNFENNQYLLQYICHGLFHDNTTYYKVQSLETYLPKVTVNFPDNFTVQGEYLPNKGIKVHFPKSPLGVDPDPEFYMVEACNRNNMSIKVGNLERYIFYSQNKEKPDLGEVVFNRNNITNPSDNRLDEYYLIFNEVDINKIITGHYNYLKFPTL